MAPYYSLTSEAGGPNSAVRFHQSDDCPEGRRIRWEQRVNGDGGLPECEWCATRRVQRAATDQWGLEAVG